MADPAAFIASWLTPSSLFIFVNLVIGTIALTSHFTAPKKQTHQHPQLHRSPSLLDRVRSFNLRHYNHHHDEPESEYTQPQLVRTPSSLLERVRSFNLSLYKHEPAHAETEYAQPGSEEPKHEEPQLARSPSLLQRVRSRLYRSDSVHQEREDPDQKPDPVGDSGDHSGEKKGRAEMKKSASGREGSGKREWEGEDEGAVERRRPATTTARSETTGDEEVDAKADDFINMFKKQLRLQRIDSILRYRGN